MGVEIEKKYRLSLSERDNVLRRLRGAGAELQREEFETNTIYRGNGIDPARTVLRLRRTERKALLTYKERHAETAASQGIRSQREDETEVADADTLAAILSALGYTPALLYEKRRATFHIADVEVVVDELPFGLFLEIEGTEEGIRAAEESLALTNAEGVAETYPELTERYGQRKGEMIEARFD